MAQQVKEMPVTARPVSASSAKNYQLGRLTQRTLLYLAVTLGAAASMLPFYWTVILANFTAIPPLGGRKR